MLSVVPRGDLQCTACFTGNYPTEIPENFSKEIFAADWGKKQEKKHNEVY